MKYINTETNEYNITQSQIKALNPNTSFPKVFKAPAPYQTVFAAPKPALTLIERAQEITPELTSLGHYEQRWEVVPKFVEYADDDDVVHTVAEQEAEAIAADAQTKAEQLQTSVEERTQARLDEFARTKTYDSILSACTYATSAVPRLLAEGQYCVSVRDETWSVLYTILGEVEAGTRPMPEGFDDIESELPELAWPV